jgi:signal transduction histidine kinase
MDVMAEICHDFSSTPDIGHAFGSWVNWIRAALRCPAASVRILLLDPGGRLRAVVERGPRLGVGTRLPAARRSTLASVRPIDVYLPDTPEYLLSIRPLAVRGVPVGVVEVVAPAPLILRWDAVLSAVTSLLAAAVADRNRRQSLRHEIGLLSRPLTMMGEVLRRPSPREGVECAAARLHSALGASVAAWHGLDDAISLDLVAVHGLGTRPSNRLRRELSSLPPWPSLSLEEQKAVEGTIGVLMDSPEVSIIVAPGVIVAIGGDPPRADERRNSLERMTEDVLGILVARDLFNRRNEQLDLGIAVTAHELRGPLLGAMAAIQSTLDAGDGEGSRELLDLSRRELKDLAGLVDSLLEWSVEGVAMTMSPTHLDEVLLRAIDSCRLEFGDDRLDVTTVPGLMVQANRRHLQRAITNIVRNALTYSPTHERVAISMSRQGDAADVNVMDRGPGIPDAEVGSIFDPLVRGRAGRRCSGAGLGLFLARRVVEAHGGSVAVASSPKGSIFRIRLPATQRWGDARE